jgi:hypothetical protein
MLDITTLAAWGEFIGGIAVVVSLIYLASQIRQNSKMLQVSAAAAIGNSDQMTSNMILGDPKLARAWSIQTAEFESLPEPEQTSLRAFVGMELSRSYRSYYFAKDRALPAPVWTAQKRLISTLLREPWARRVFDEVRFGFSEEFGEFVDGLVREDDPAA